MEHFNISSKGIKSIKLLINVPILTKMFQVFLLEKVLNVEIFLRINNYYKTWLKSNILHFPVHWRNQNGIISYAHPGQI